MMNEPTGDGQASMVDDDDVLTAAYQAMLPQRVKYLPQRMRVSGASRAWLGIGGAQ